MSDCPEKQPESYRIEVHNSMQIIDKQQWNGLLHDDDPPFIRHEFLDLLEESESATSETGWSPCHLTLHSDQGDLDAASIIGAAPAYFKQHSYGEYVFDWAWARAYQQHGLDYYPKLLCAIPFTPVTTRKFLGHKDQTPNIESLLTQGLRQIAEQEKLSSIHILFCPQKEIEAISEQKFLERQDNQFHWHNNKYADFEHYLTDLTAKKRKNIRQERRQILDQGIHFEWLSADESQESDWHIMYKMYENTVQQHGGHPYLSEKFFHLLPEKLPNHCLILKGAIGRKTICSALFFKSSTSLYGRYWGADGFYPQLHFETCYYQPIEYSINNQLERFEAGAQGQHKLSRGLIPSITRSAHWLRHPGFHDAIDQYLVSERTDMEQYKKHLDTHTPFKQK